MKYLILLLFVFQSFTGNIFSQDSYYSLGGHLFAGEYPINNPVSTGDTGIVFLYQLNNNIIIPVDSTQFSNLGYFVFLDLPEGEYILKAGLTKNSTHYNNFFPTYYKSSLRWNSSNSLNLTDSSMFEANIRLLPTYYTLLGNASIKGCVVQSSDEDGYKKIANTEVLLLDDKLDPLNFCLSDDKGNFSFSNLPYGTYHLSIESTGMFSALIKITLNQDHSDFDNLVLEVLSHQPATIEESGQTSGMYISQVFPNPAKDFIGSVVKTKEPSNLDIGIYSLTGIKIISFNLQAGGTRSFKIPVGSLAKGTYILMIRSSDNHLTQVQKFVKL
jgi:hypothetical protein